MKILLYTTIVAYSVVKCWTLQLRYVRSATLKKPQLLQSFENVDIDFYSLKLLQQIAS